MNAEGPGLTLNIASRLSAQAAKMPDRVAIYAPGAPASLLGATVAALPTGVERTIHPWQQVTFHALDQVVGRLAAGLIRMGIGRGVRTLVMVRAGVELIALAFALFRAGAVPVLIDPGMGRTNFLKSVERAAPEAMVGIPLAHLMSKVFSGPFGSVRRRVTVGWGRWLWGGEDLAGLLAGGQIAPPADTMADDPAAVLFTSGSTGPAKGVCYTHGIFDAQVEALQRIFAFGAGEVDLAAFPLFSLFDGALGMTTVIPDLDPGKPAACDPKRVAEAAALWGCTSATGSPAIWRKVFGDCADRGVQLPKMRRLMTFGAPIPISFIEVVRRVLPAGEVYTPYGATEALPVACIAGSEVLSETGDRTREGAGTCVGRTDLEVRVLPISDAPIADMAAVEPLPAGEIGEICVAGPVVTTQYDALPEATAGAKIAEHVQGGARIWHRMGDLGYLDERGRLWFCGRKAERLQTAAGPLYTEPVEGVFNAWPDVGRCALVGPGPAGAQVPVLVVEGAERAELRARILATKLVKEVVFYPKLPVDTRHNAKIHRLTLRRELETRRGLAVR